MIVTKTEFRKMFGFKDASSVSHLLRKKTIIENNSGMIDLDNKTNKKWAKAREKELIKKQRQEDDEQKKTSKKEKSENQIGLEVEILNQKLKEQQQKATLMDLKIAREQKTVVEVDVLNRVITTVFNSLFKNLSELPSVYVDDVVNIVKTNKSPKEAVVKFLTEKVLSEIRSGLEVAENTAKKYYE